jgi:hypothetical protein
MSLVVDVQQALYVALGSILALDGIWWTGVGSIHRVKKKQINT